MLSKLDTLSGALVLISIQHRDWSISIAVFLFRLWILSVRREIIAQQKKETCIQKRSLVKLRKKKYYWKSLRIRTAKGRYAKESASRSRYVDLMPSIAEEFEACEQDCQ